MLKPKNIFFPLTIFLFMASCSYDNLEEYYDEIICDTIDITYAGTVLPILERNCLGCHYTGNSIGIELEEYDDLIRYVDNGKFLGSVKHLPGFVPMPQGGKLDDCTIQKLEIWVVEGALEN